MFLVTILRSTVWVFLRLFTLMQVSVRLSPALTGLLANGAMLCLILLRCVGLRLKLMLSDILGAPGRLKGRTLGAGIPILLSFLYGAACRGLSLSVVLGDLGLLVFAGLVVMGVCLSVYDGLVGLMALLSVLYLLIWLLGLAVRMGLVRMGGGSLRKLVLVKSGRLGSSLWFTLRVLRYRGITGLQIRVHTVPVVALKCLRLFRVLHTCNRLRRVLRLPGVAVRHLSRCRLLSVFVLLLLALLEKVLVIEECDVFVVVVFVVVPWWCLEMTLVTSSSRVVVLVTVSATGRRY